MRWQQFLLLSLAIPHLFISSGCKDAKAMLAQLQALNANLEKLPLEAQRLKDELAGMIPPLLQSVKDGALDTSRKIMNEAITKLITAAPVLGDQFKTVAMGAVSQGLQMAGPALRDALSDPAISQRLSGILGDSIKNGGGALMGQLQGLVNGVLGGQNLAGLIGGATKTSSTGNGQVIEVKPSATGTSYSRTTRGFGEVNRNREEVLTDSETFFSNGRKIGGVAQVTGGHRQFIKLWGK